LPPFRFIHKYAGVGEIGVATLGVGLPSPCCIPSRGSFLRHLEPWFGVGTIGVAWRPSASICQSCRMPSRGSSLLYSDSCLGVRTLGVDFPSSCRRASTGSSLVHYKLCVGVGTIGVAWRRLASGHSASICHRHVVCHPETHLCHTPILVSASERYASRYSASGTSVISSAMRRLGQIRLC
jgi:hypothetical protein